MAKNKPKINNTINPPRYRVVHMHNRIDIQMDGGSYFGFCNNGFVYVEYKNNKLNRVYEVPDYTHISTSEEMFQEELLCDIPMEFKTLVHIQKSLKHHFEQYLYPSKRELCNMKIKYIIDTEI